MSDQKYRQHGYMDRDRDRESQSSRPKAKPSEMTFGPRALNMPGTRQISRCASCGVVLNALGDAANCSKCGFALHSCKQCAHFDPAARFECRQPVKERVARKDVANVCPSYTIAVRVERETSTSAGRVEDARRAFENLFKK